MLCVRGVRRVRENKRGGSALVSNKSERDYMKNLRKYGMFGCVALAASAASADTNTVNALVAAGGEVAGDLPTIIAAGIAIFVILWGVHLLKRGLKAGAGR